MIYIQTNEINKYKRIEIIPSMFFSHTGVKLDLINRRKFGEATNPWKLNKILLNNQWIKEETDGLENTEMNSNENTT